jgi:hypothetical protein
VVQLGSRERPVKAGYPFGALRLLRMTPQYFEECAGFCKLILKVWSAKLASRSR